jgi:hypothetical protein
MNLAVRRFTLFFFSLATLASCEDPSDIGLDLQDENQIGAFYTDTLTINSGTVLHSDSVLAFKQLPLPIGGYQDATLGSVKATAFTEVSLSGTGLSFGTNPVADSLVLSLDYTTDIYGAKGIAPLTLNVHRLTENFQDKASYFTTSSLNYDGNALGTVTFQPKVVTNDSTKTEQTVPARIRLNLALANELLAQSGKDPLKDQAKFIQFFKGIAIVPTQDARVLIALNTGSNKTKLTLYYKNGTEKKEHSFFMSGSSTRNFSKIEANRTATALAGLDKYELLPSTETGGETYVQAGTQLLTKLTIPHLTKMKEKYGNIIINRAELVVPVKTNSFETLLAPEYLGIYETNNSNQILYASNGQPRTVPIDNPNALDSYTFPTALAFVGKEGTKEANYRVNVTAYVQAIIDGKKPNTSLLITPAKFQASADGNLLSNESIPKRAILVNTADRGVKLRIYFSKLD